MTAEDTLKQWQDDDAAARARFGARGVATPQQLIGLTGLEQMQKLLSGDFPPP